jgi:ectoine hydroxylase-related dioxygenase (phytanoyl-CoA dioxygenase family)
MLGLKNFFRTRFRIQDQRKDEPAGPPWFDRPDALTLLEKRRKKESLSDPDFELLRHWVEHGYVVARDLVPTEHIDGMMTDLDNLWTTTTPIENLSIDGLVLHPEDPPAMTHSKLVAADPATKEKLKRECHWRIHEFISYSKSALEIYRNQKLIQLSSLILGRRADPNYTINFAYGSTQNLHQDTAVFAVFPMNNILGAWLACEDIDRDSGPLVYYPGSHRENLFAQFDNYPQTNLRTCPRDMFAEYERYVEMVSQRYERKTFIARKGECFLWHGMMIHGGDAIRNPNLTRRSYVCHYIPPGMNKHSELKGPFNW